MNSNFGIGLTALSSAALLTLNTQSAFAQLRAFGEAEGYGAAATGGRAATSVYHVTNLNDSGAGSFRDAVSGSNRIVVFDVAGEIVLKSGISAQSNLTIAGQTAPGAGITLTGYQAIGFTQRTNDIMRYVRMRPGDNSPASDNGMSMTRSGTVILDHVSIEFGKYNNIDAVAQTGDSPRITIQNSIIADPISTGTSTRGQGFGAHLEAVNGYYTLSNNLWANSHSRNPLAKVNEQFKNNIEYNNEVGYLTSGTSSAFQHDLVNNAFIFGPASTGSSDFGQLSTPDKFYAVGNVQDTNKDGVWNPTATTPSATIANAATPYHASTAGLPTLSADDAYAYVTAHAGASLVRDDLDALVVGQVQTLGKGTAGYTAGTTGPTSTTVPFDTVHEGLYWKAYLTGLPNGGLGTTASSGRPADFDVDRDGIADAWERTHGLNPAVASDAFKPNPLGYLMVEQYINELGSTNDSVVYAGGAVSAAMNYGLVRGTGTANANVALSSGTASLMKLSIGGNGPAAGETLTVSGSGNLSVYDTIAVGDQNNAALNVSGGTVSAYNVVLGNTVYSPNAVDNIGTLNFTGGTLNLSQLVLGAGSAGAWTRGGSMNWTGGTLKAAAVLKINVPMKIGGSGGTIDTNGFDGTLSGTMADASGSPGGLIKKGSGTLTVTGTHTITGASSVQAGTLVVNGSMAGSALAITGTGTLGGNGTFKSITQSPAGTIAPGNGIGTINVGESAILDGKLALDYTGVGAGSIDKLDVGGLLDLTGSTLFLTLLTGGTAADDPSYVLADYGSLLGTFASVTGLPSGYAINYAYNDGTGPNHIAIVPVSSVPEPAALVVFGLAAAAESSRRRRASA